MSAGDSISIQATIGGMSANSPEVVTILGALDPMTGVLVIDAAVVVKPGAAERRYGNSAAVSNNPKSQARDALFTEADIRDAIAAYMEFAGRGLLEIQEAVARFNPQSAIEPDGVDEHGRKYRISTEMTNGKLSVIALCWMAHRQSSVNDILDAQDGYADLFDITTVGIDTSSHVGGVPIGRDGWPE